MSQPSARAIARPLRGIDVERMADAAQRRQREKPARKRCTRPPSWSTATISAGVRTAWICSTSARSCVGSM